MVFTISMPTVSYHGVARFSYQRLGTYVYFSFLPVVPFAITMKHVQRRKYLSLQLDM